MTIKQLIKLLQKYDQDKEIEFSSYSEGINMSISGVSEEDNIVFIEE